MSAVAHPVLVTLCDGVFVSLVATSAFSDIVERRVSNRLVGLLGVGGLIGSATGLTAVPLMSATAGILLGVGIWFPLWVLGWIGAGDVKFFGAAAGWVGPALAWRASLGTAVIGGFLAGAFAIWLRRQNAEQSDAKAESHAPSDTSAGASGVADETMQSSPRSFPYAVPMAIMLVIARLAPQWLQPS